MPSLARSASLDTRASYPSTAAPTIAAFTNDSIASKTHSITISKALAPNINREAAGDNRGYRRPSTLGGGDLSEIQGLSVSGRGAHPREVNAALATRRPFTKRAAVPSGKYATTATLMTVGSRSRPKEKDSVLQRAARSEKHIKSPGGYQLFEKFPIYCEISHSSTFYLLASLICGAPNYLPES